MKRKVEYRPEPECANCGGTHYGNSTCPFAVPYDADDSIGEKRGLSHTCNTVKKGPYKVVETGS